jgi:hypothetical protein
VLWDGSNDVDLYLGTCMVAACKGRERLFVSNVNGREQALDALGSWLQGRQLKAKTRVWLSGSLCRPLVLPPVARASVKELEAIAVSLVPAQLGWPSAVAVRVDVARDGGAIAVVTQQGSLDGLERVLGQAGVRPASIQPWWAAMLREALGRDREVECVAVQDCDSICLLAGAGRSLESAAIISPTTDVVAAESAVARLRFNLGITAPVLTARLRVAADGPIHDARHRAFGNWVEWSQ